MTTHTINNIRKSEAGIYQCMSSNDAGMAYSAIEVKVIGDQPAVDNEVPDNIGKILPGRTCLNLSRTGSCLWKDFFFFSSLNKRFKFICGRSVIMSLLKEFNPPCSCAIVLIQFCQNWKCLIFISIFPLNFNPNILKYLNDS